MNQHTAPGEYEPEPLDGFDPPEPVDQVEVPAPVDPLSHEERLKTDRPSKHGLPPDFGEEQPVVKIHPALIRAKPGRTLTLAVLPIIATVATYLLVEPGTQTRSALLALGIGAVVCWIPLAIWWLIATRGRALEITNKRTVERRGILSKSTDEVLHDHVRNIKVDQTFRERLLRIGQIGIASSGSDQTEIIMKDLPHPQEIRKVIDLYRPLD